MKSKYTAFTQQPYCCVPASLQMVMYRHGIPLVEQEDLANAFGLVVPEEDLRFFNDAKTGKKPSSGWGTQISKYDTAAVFKELGVPLTMEFHTKIDSVEQLRKLLQDIQDADGDALLCFDYGVLWDKDFRGGHVCVFDSIETDIVKIVDPAYNVPKFRENSLEQFFKAMQFHGSNNTSGVWTVKSE